jgi:Kdo2-lipid IVA lauroyltransferase/acyltransferase
MPLKTSFETRYRISTVLIRVLAHTPLRGLRALGWLLGSVAYFLHKKRRHITRCNLAIALPHLSETANIALAKKHLRHMGMALVDRIWLWFSPLEVVNRRISLTGFEHLPSTVMHAGIPSKGVILLVPHFIGLEAAGPAWVSECQKRGLPEPTFVSIFQSQTTVWQDALYRHGRGRFANILQFVRQEGIRPAIKGMRQGRHFYCLPDNDHGEKDSLFIPFFGVPAATLTVLPKLSALLNTTIVPLIATMTPAGYQIEAHEPWPVMGNNPDDLESELTLINAAIERWILTMPEQYLFSHRRYKTRPKDQPSVYE